MSETVSPLALQNAKEIERQRCVGIIMQMLEMSFGDPSLQASYERAVLRRAIDAMSARPSPTLPT
jgi:hypothetical protein